MVLFTVDAWVDPNHSAQADLSDLQQVLIWQLNNPYDCSLGRLILGNADNLETEEWH